MSETMTTGRVKCGNRKVHGYETVAYHASAEAVRSCYAGTSVWHSTGPTSPDGHWAVRCPGASCPVVQQQAQRCCDGTGWTGDPKAPCAEHYQPQNFSGFVTPVAEPAPEPEPAKPAFARVSVEEMQTWRKIPVGRGDTAYYALLAADSGEVSFFRVRRPSEGKYAGKTYVDQQSGDNFLRMDFRPSAAVLSAIAKNPLAAAVLYGKKIKRCAMCHRSLTDDKNKGKDGLTSLERGIGPDCAEKMGLV